MKAFTRCLTIVFVLIIISITTSSAQPTSGQDKRVEWKQLQSWSTGAKVIDLVHSLDKKYVFLLTADSTVKIFNSSGSLQGEIPVEAGVAAIDIAPQGETLYLIDNANRTFAALSISFVVDVDISGAPIKGPADAPVTITLFTDFECPYCKKILPLLDEVLKRNPQTVNLAFKNMPLRFHKMAEPSARAALAAHEQGKFWEFHDRLFAAEKLTNEAISAIAKDLGLDMTRFAKDLNAAKIQAKIQEDLLDAQKAGVTGTPTIFINGRTPQQRSLAGIQAVIDDELGKQEANKQ